MAKPKKSSASTPPPLATPEPIVVVPPAPTVEVPLAVPLVEQKSRIVKHPLTGREHPGARDARGTASRSEIRKATQRVVAPRKTGGIAERSNQPRSKKAK
jgi:hypothetical protein